MNIDINSNIIKERSALSSKASSRSSLIFSSTSSVPYHQHIKINNNIPDIKCWKPIDCSQLLYKGNVKVRDFVRTATNKLSPKKKQCTYNKVPTLKKAPKPQGKDVTNNNSNTSLSQNTINIQLLCNVNQATELEAQDRDFHSVSLHGLIEHLTSDAKNIRESLHHMIKYILNKKVESSKTNKINNFKGIGEVMWSFILALYKSEQDELIANNNNNFFRQKLKAQFTPKTNEGTSNKNNKNKNMDKPTLFHKLPPLILAKSPKKINEISKFFKKNNDKKEQKKLYT